MLNTTNHDHDRTPDTLRTQFERDGPSPLTSAERRRMSDGRHRAAGLVRAHTWLPAQRMRDLDDLMEAWGFADRAEAIDVSIRFLVKYGPSMDRLVL